MWTNHIVSDLESLVEFFYGVQSSYGTCNNVVMRCGLVLGFAIQKDPMFLSSDDSESCVEWYTSCFVSRSC